MNYFAYGNLMDITVMRRVAPSATVVAVARLDGYRLAFARCADPGQAGCTIERAPGTALWGVQYDLSAADMAALDRAAGVPEGHWQRLPISVTDGAGRVMASTTYEIPNASGPYAPPESYIAPIRAGARASGLPADYLEELERRITAHAVTES